MATRATTSSSKKKSPSRVKKSAPKTSSKPVVKKMAKKAAGSPSNKVDFYPNRMTLAISVLAGTLLVLISLIAVLGVQ